MPAAPILVVGAAATGAAAAVGTTVIAAVTTATVSTAVATAVGSGVIAGAITAAQGGDAGDILKSAVVSGGASYLGGMAGGAVKGALPGSTSAAVSNAVSAAAAGGTGSTVGALAYGASPEKALEAGLKGAAVGGLAQAGVEGIKAASAQQPQQAGEARLKVPQPQTQYEVGKPIPKLFEDIPTRTSGFTDRIPTGTGLAADPSLVYSSRFAPSQPMRLSETGELTPAYTSVKDLITPSSLAGYTEPYREAKEFNPPPLTRSRERVLGEALELGLSEALTDRSTPTQQPQTAYLGTGGISPGSQALAQALRVDSGTALFGSDKEGRRRPVWNVESLKLKDEMGA